MGQKKGKKIVYWFDKVSYSTFYFVLFILFWDAAYPKFWIYLFGYLMIENGINKIDVQLSYDNVHLSYVYIS